MDEHTVSAVASALEEARARLDPRAPVDVFVFLHLEDTFRLPRRSDPRDGVPRRIRELLAALSELCTVTVLGERDREVIAGALGLDGIVTVGNGGLEIQGPEGLYLEHADARLAQPELAAVERELALELVKIPAVTVRRRSYSVEVSYRDATVAERRVVRHVAAEAVRRREKLLLLRRGSRIRIRPDVEWDARMAILWILEVLAGDTENVLPLYLGRHAGGIRAVFHSGIGIGIGRISARHATPHFRFENSGNAERFLRSLHGILEAHERERRRTA